MNYLVHGSMWKKHKYIVKEIVNGKVRYIYSKKTYSRLADKLGFDERDKMRIDTNAISSSPVSSNSANEYYDTPLGKLSKLPSVIKTKVDKLIMSVADKLVTSSSRSYRVLEGTKVNVITDDNGNILRLEKVE